MNKKIQEVQNDEAMLLPKVDFCFKELMRDDEIRQGFIAAILKENPEKLYGHNYCQHICEKNMKKIS